MIILFPANPLNSNIVDLDFLDEYNMAQRYEMQTLLFNLEELINHEKLELHPKREPIERETVIYRGWMLTKNQYKNLYNQLNELNYQLINSPTQYQNTHYFPSWYNSVKNVTPFSLYSDSLPSDDQINSMLLQFGFSPVIVKDYVKSRKHEWFDAFYIPNANDTTHAKHVIRTFIERQGADLAGGIVLRKFEQLAKVLTYDIDRIENFEEIRVFVYHHKPLAYINYWDNDFNFIADELQSIIQNCNGIDSNFFTVDLGKKEDGSWIIIEIGDAQVSGLQHYPTSQFYQALKQSSRML